MGLYRIYTNGETKTQIDELDLASSPELTTEIGTQHIFFREWAPGHFIDWHPAPRRQYIISISGTIDVGLEELWTRRCPPSGRHDWKGPHDAGTRQ